MKCLLCESLAVADCLCVPCGAKVWVCQARFSNNVDALANLDVQNPIDAERVAAREMITNLGDASAFSHRLFLAQEAERRRAFEFGQLQARRECDLALQEFAGKGE